MTDQFKQAEINIPDVKEILFTLWFRRTLIALIMLAVIALGSLAVLSKPGVYKATAILMLDGNNITLNDFEDVTESTKFDDKTLQTEVKVLTSPSLALQTIKAEKLNTLDEFKAETEAAALPAFLAALSVNAQNSSRVLEVSFASKDPALAARIANAHVENYMQMQISNKQKRIEDLSKWFEGRVEALKADVVKKAQAVSAYQAKENVLFDKDDEDLVVKQISEISAELAPIELKKIEIESKIAAIDEAEKSGNAAAIGEIVNSGLIQRLKEQSVTKLHDNNTASLAYGPNHPKRLAMQSGAGEYNAAIKQEVAAIKAALHNDAKAAAIQQQKLNEKLAELKLQADKQREKMIVLKSMMVEQEASQKVLDTFIANYETVQSQTSFAKADAEIISAAAAPQKPFSASKKLQLLAVFAFAGCLALAVVFVLEVLRPGVRGFAELQKMGQSSLAILPLNNLSGQQSPSYKEAVRRLYMGFIMNSSARALLVTSAAPQEGRTHVATSLAQYIASLGHKVLLVDADFIRPVLSRNFSKADAAGLADVLAGKATLDEAVINTADNLAILAAGRNATSMPDILRSEKLGALLADLKNRYEYVLIDTGPVLSHSEVRILLPQVDGVLAVVEWLKTSRNNIARMYAILRQFRTPVIGTVLNRVDIEKYKSSNLTDDFLLPNQGA